MHRRDPRIQQTLDRITETFETANTATQTTFYDFSSQYLHPCLDSVSECFSQSCAPCVDFARGRARARQRAIMRSQRPEAIFDFYADWDDDPYEYDTDGNGTEGARHTAGSSGRRGAASGGGGSGSGHANERTGLLSSWGVDELDRLLAGRPKEDRQPRRQGSMTYGTTRVPAAKRDGGKAPAALAKSSELNDPNVVPASSKFGFLERLPFKLGPRNLRYKPSAAHMQEGVLQRSSGSAQTLHEDGEEDVELMHDRTEGEALLDDIDGLGNGRSAYDDNDDYDNDDDNDDNDDRDDKGAGEGGHSYRGKRRRVRRGTADSGETDESYSSRGDLFPSDDEGDAVMIDDEMALTLGRRHRLDSADELNAQDVDARLKRSSGSLNSSQHSSAINDAPEDVSLLRPEVSSQEVEKRQQRQHRQQAEDDMEESREHIAVEIHGNGAGDDIQLPTMHQLQMEDEQVRREEEEEVLRRREEAHQLMKERGLLQSSSLSSLSPGERTEVGPSHGKDNASIADENHPTSAARPDDETTDELP